MKKKILFISLAVVLALSVGLIGCEGEQEEEQEPELTLLFSDHNPEGNAMAEALTVYAEYIKNHSDGKIAYEIYYAESLLGQQAVFEGLQDRTADCANYVPEQGDGLEYIQVMVMPFMGWPSRAAALEIYWDLVGEYDEILGQLPSSICLPTMYLMPAVHLHYYAENFTADDPGDIAGEVILTMEASVDTILDTLGAEGSMVTFGEIMSGIPAGLGDGYAQHLEFCAFFNLLQYLHSHTIFEGGIFMVPIGTLWNTAAYNETVALVGQEVMDEAHAEWLSEAYAKTALDTALAAEVFTQHADEHWITSLNSTEIVDNGWVAAVSTYVNDWKNACDNPTLAQDIYDRALELIAA